MDKAQTDSLLKKKREMKTIDAARGKWMGILIHLGVDQSFLRDKHGPCPICQDGKDRFRWDDKNGDGTYFCNTCGSGTGMQLAMHWTGKSFADTAREIDGVVGNIEKVDFKKPGPDPAIRLREVAASREPMGRWCPVVLYLASRGLVPAAGIEYATVKYWNEGSYTVHPAMVCLIRGKDGTPLSWHVTHLTKSGGKADIAVVRKILPPISPLAGAAMRLGGDAEDIGIAEGVETALAVAQATGAPCWAVSGTALMESFSPPDWVRSVTIYGDNDESYAGHKAAYTLAFKLRDKCSVGVNMAEIVGTDFADQFIARNPAGRRAIP